jgi:hypothetical protein
VAASRLATPLQYHEACAGYSSAIAYGRRLTAMHPREPHRHGNIPPTKVELEFARGRHIHCTLCGQPGATLNCKGIAACGCVWHLPCAREAAQSTGDVSFSANVFEAACKKHANMSVRRSRWLLLCCRFGHHTAEHVMLSVLQDCKLLGGASRPVV